MRRLLAVAAAVWVGRWAVLELASYAGSHWLRPGPPPNRSARPPGVMPGPRPDA